MQNSLNTTSGGGTQTTTQNPQTATSGSNLTSSQSNLQSSQVNLFNSTSARGVSLAPSALPAVSLPASSSTPSSSVVPAVKPHHANGVLLAIVLVILVMAIASFWKITLAAKSTTD